MPILRWPSVTAHQRACIQIRARELTQCRGAESTQLDENYMMQQEEPTNDADISLFAIGHTLLSSRKLIGKFVVAGAIVALISTIWLTPRYKASTTFVSSAPQTGNGA